MFKFDIFLLYRLTVTSFAKFINSHSDFFHYFDEYYQIHCNAFKRDWTRENLPSYISAVCNNKQDGYIVIEVRLCIYAYLVYLFVF